MSNLKQTFEKFHVSFQQKKDFFKQRIERWQAKGRLKEYQAGMALFGDVEKLDRELQNNFMQAAASLDERALRAQVKAFKARYKELNEITKAVWRQWTESLVFALGLAFVLKTFVFGLYNVPSGSAEPNILVGDYVFANKMIYFFQKPQRGEFVIFDNPEKKLDESSTIQYFWQKYIGFPVPLLGLQAGPENVVKRVIALPGDTIEGRVEENKPVIYLNGKKLDEPYVNSYPLLRVRRTKGFIDGTSFGPFKLPEFLGLEYQVDDHVSICTYDPSQSFDDQPYYKLSEDIVARNPITGDLLLIPPHSPIEADVFGPITLPEGKYWVMGDSRNNSYDSRFWKFLDESLIHGRASFVILSIDKSETLWIYDLIKHPIDFWTKHVRWNCFFKSLRQYYGRQDLEK